MTTSSARLRPRRTVHRGHVLARGVIVEVGVEVGLARLATLVDVGTQLKRLDADRLVVLWTVPRRFDVDEAPGALLVEIGPVLSTAPLTTKEREALQVAGETVVVVVEGGVAVVHRFADLRDVQVADLVALDGFDIVGVRAPPTPPAPTVVEQPTSAAVFDSVVPMRVRQQTLEAARAATAPTPPGLVSRLLAGFAQALSTTPSPPTSSGSAATTNPTTTTTTVQLVKRSTTSTSPWSVPLLDLVRAGLHRLSMWAGGRRQQAAYVRELVELFETGRLDEALRRAIAVDGQSSSTARAIAGVPDPRQALVIRHGDTAATTTMSMGDDVTALLRRQYRASVDTLVKAGRIREAAFVLIELLHDVDAGVRLLEDNGERAFAAEIAEARALDPALVVRLWWLAGNKERAVDVARRTGAFANTVQRLSETDRGAALRLRAEWAKALVRGGDVDGAIEVLWAEPALRVQAHTLMRKAMRADGDDVGLYAVRVAYVDAAWFDASIQVLQRALDETGDDAIQARLRLAEGLVALAKEASNGDVGDAVRVLARPILRQLIVDHAAAPSREGHQLLTPLARIADDGPLRLDLEALPRAPATTPSTSSTSTALTELELDGPAGHFPIHDVCLLHKARLALALGHAGVHVVSRTGTTQTRLRAPVEAFVVNDSFDHALGLMSRGDRRWQTTKLSFSAQRAEPWCDVVADAFAGDTDGSMWFVSDGDSLVGLDLHASAARALWRVGDLGLVLSVTRDRQGITAICAQPPSTSPLATSGAIFEVFEWSTALTLHHRREVAFDWRTSIVEVAPGGMRIVAWADDVTNQKTPAPRVSVHRAGTTRVVDVQDPLPSVLASRAWTVVPSRTASGTSIAVFAEDAVVVRLTIAAFDVKLRLQGRFLVVADEHGRAFAVDLRARQIVTRARALA